MGLLKSYKVIREIDGWKLIDKETYKDGGSIQSKYMKVINSEIFIVSIYCKRYDLGYKKTEAEKKKRFKKIEYNIEKYDNKDSDLRIEEAIGKYKNNDIKTTK